MPVQVIIGVEEEPRIQFTITVESLDEMPQVIQMTGGPMLVLSGRYLDKGDRYRYIRVDRIKEYEGPIREWPRYTRLGG